MWSVAKAKVNHRLALHLRVDPFRLGNTTPMVSFTFDDIPKSAATTGADLLEQYRAHGTFYIAGGLVDRPSPYWLPASDGDLVALHRGGHELACHTFSHTRACDLDAGRNWRRHAGICGGSTPPSRSRISHIPTASVPCSANAS